ncbi:hypothetical protein JCM15548_13028 [Geofilum rubicundum JCM 15548]|uniref:Transcriptional regulator, AbiEi antitoxin, Type IV TA system n=1 Tax=Geofilum rubicundum JCM 15548 TaxID=1236989 RepID=A0A0E9LYQ5_9BACT|nr:hypothetical protein JCM15548_13028 [Geofilum rubicundum JCM 15548]
MGCDMYDLSKYGNIPIESSVLQEAMAAYSSPNDRISRLESDGQLIRLKRGLYVVDPNVSGVLLSSELIANRIYGPSYVSMQSALRFHALIPERVTVMVSATTKRARNFQNSLGLFEYESVPPKYFSVGIQQLIHENSYAFLIASPEKAICDLLITTSGLRLQSRRAAYNYLVEDMRIDLDERPSWDTEIFRQCAEFGRKGRELLFIENVLRNG